MCASFLQDDRADHRLRFLAVYRWLEAFESGDAADDVFGRRVRVVDPEYVANSRGDVQSLLRAVDRVRAFTLCGIE